MSSNLFLRGKKKTFPHQSTRCIPNKTLGERSKKSQKSQKYQKFAKSQNIFPNQQKFQKNVAAKIRHFLNPHQSTKQTSAEDTW